VYYGFGRLSAEHDRSFRDQGCNQQDEKSNPKLQPRICLAWDSIRLLLAWDSARWWKGDWNTARQDGTSAAADVGAHPVIRP
jgi:hypothetical protein